MAIDESIALIIPAYNPNHHLIDLLEEIKTEWKGPIFIVNDGSEETIYIKKAEEQGFTILKHYKNTGKGRSIKTAINYGLLNYKSLIGFVTCDCDGKFAGKDVLKVAESLMKSPDKFILGARNIDSEILPNEMRTGIKAISKIMNVSFGIKVSDSLSGLRGIPKSYAEICLNISGERYEFDTNVLLESKKSGIEISEIPIETIYIEDNKESHFKPLEDTLRMASAIIKFAFSSGACSFLDILLFSFFSTGIFIGKYGIIFSTISARIVSGALNFFINRRVVFGQDKENRNKASKKRYFVLVVGIMLASAAMVQVLSIILPLPSVILKVMVDFFLWFCNYYFQRTWVFA